MSSTDGASFWAVSSLTAEAVLQTVIVCVTGFCAATGGYLDRSAQKSISQLNVNIFTPCLVFSKIASRLSVKALIDISIIPVIFVLSTVISYSCGQVCSRIFRFSEREGNFVTAMAVFGNSNSVPVSLFLNLAASLPALQWPSIPDDNADNVASRGLMYLLIFQQLGQMLRWSWGYNTLLAAAPSSLPAPATRTEDEAGASELRPKRFWRTLYKDVVSFMNPPLWAMLGAVVVASIQPLRELLYGEQKTFVNRTVGLGIQQVGQTAVPLILVVLGANLAPPRAHDAASQQRNPRYGQLIFASLVSRMILPCIILLPMLALAVRYLGISILDDPAFLVASFILTASPPAIQLSQICQINQVFEAEMAGVLFWGYVVLALPSSILIVGLAIKVLDWTQLSVSTAADLAHAAVDAAVDAAADVVANVTAS